MSSENMPSAKASVFISGAAGFLGSHAAESALSQGLRVVGCDNFSSGLKTNVATGTEFHPLDIEETQKLIPLLKGIDVVFHTAALPYDSLSVFSPFEITRSVYSLTASLLSAAIQAKVKRFVFCSSMARYGSQTSPFKESMEPCPSTPYGLAKIAAEKLLLNMSRMHGIEAVILVPHNLFGPRQRFDDPYRNAVAVLIHRMLKDLPPLVYGNGEQRRCFSPIQDVIPLFPSLFFSEKAKGEIINAGPERDISLNQLIDILNRIMGKNLKALYVDSRPGEVQEAFCDSAKARGLFGYQPSASLEEALEEMISYVQAAGPQKFSYKERKIEIWSDKTPAAWKNQLF